MLVEVSIFHCSPCTEKYFFVSLSVSFRAGITFSLKTGIAKVRSLTLSPLSNLLFGKLSNEAFCLFVASPSKGSIGSTKFFDGRGDVFPNKPSRNHFCLNVT